MRIALLGNSLLRQDLLKRYLPFPYEPVAANGERSRVDVVISRVFGPTEAARFDYTLLQVPGTGIDGIELDALPPERWLCNVYEHEAPIAEYVMATILEHAIGIGEMSRTFQPERWGEVYAKRANHREIAGTTLGLIGFGHIGRALAVRAAAFGMRVHAVTSGRTHPEGIDWSGDPERLDEMLRVADFIVVACPLDQRTRGMIAARELSLMKPHAVLINVARAEVVVEEDLYRALESSKLGGATLDVWYAYPSSPRDGVSPSRFPFHDLPNVFCTPHACALTEELWERRFKAMAENIVRLHDGRPLQNVVRGPK